MSDPAAQSAGAPLQRRVAELWAEALRRASVGPSDDFLALGGDSLSAVLLVEMVEETFGVTLSPVAVFDDAYTIEKMSDAIAEEKRREVRRGAPPSLPRKTSY